MHKDAKKAYDTAITMKTILQNQLIDATPEKYLTKCLNPNEGYNQSIFFDIIFHIFDQYTLITDTMVSLTNQWKSTDPWPSTWKCKKTAHLLQSMLAS